MNTSIAAGICLALSLGLPLLTLYALSRLRPGKSLLSVALAFSAWLALTGLLAARGVFSDFTSLPPRLILAVMPPVVIILTLTFHPRLKSLWQDTPMVWLIGFQVFRLPVEIMLWLLAHEGIAPPQMSFEGRNWDILTGITAPVAAWLWLQRPSQRTSIALAWNLFGLALLLNIMTVAILSVPTPFQVFQPANTFVASLPFIWLPSVLVPFALVGHCLALRQLWLERKASGEQLAVSY